MLGAARRLPLPRPVVWRRSPRWSGVATLLPRPDGRRACRAGCCCPRHWGELTDGLDRGLAGVQGVEWPYDGPDEWIRLTILLGRPAAARDRGDARLLAGAPRRAPLLRDRGPRRAAAPLRRGRDRARPGRAAPARAGAAAAGGGLAVAAAPAAARGAARRPRWWRASACSRCRWPPRSTATAPGGTTTPGAGSASGKAVTFDWTHEYGPLDWPRDGHDAAERRSRTGRTTGRRRRSTPSTGCAGSARGAERQRASGRRSPSQRIAHPTARLGLLRVQPELGRAIGFTVRSLSSDLWWAPASRYEVDGVDARRPAPTAPRGCLAGPSSSKGDIVHGPTPTRPTRREDQMRGAPEGYSELPDHLHGDPPAEPGRERDRGRRAPGRRRPRAGRPAPRQRCSCRCAATATRTRRRGARRPGARRYARMYALAQRLTADAADRLRRGQGRRALPAEQLHATASACPTRPLPLNGFLFEERRGYCQQFSGAMALMLRMAGIPARVAAGFSPGSFNKDTQEYRVRDLDAHSWVEVWFTGHRLGAVRPDAGRARRPSRSRARSPRAPRPPTPARSRRARGRGRRARPDTGAPRRAADGGRRLARCRVLLLLLLAPLGRRRRCVVGRRVRRAARARARPSSPSAQLSELRRALLRLGWDLPAVHHAARPRAPARALRRTRLGGLRGRAARQPLRPARRRTAPGLRRAPRSCAASSPAAASATGCAGCSRSRRAARVREPRRARPHIYRT